MISAFAGSVSPVSSDLNTGTGRPRNAPATSYSSVPALTSVEPARNSTGSQPTTAAAGISSPRSWYFFMCMSPCLPLMICEPRMFLPSTCER